MHLRFVAPRWPFFIVGVVSLKRRTPFHSCPSLLVLHHLPLIQLKSTYLFYLPVEKLHSLFSLTVNLKVNEERAKEILSLEVFEVLVDLGIQGDGEARYWTCDFSCVSWLEWYNELVILLILIRIGICENRWGLSQLKVCRTSESPRIDDTPFLVQEKKSVKSSQEKFDSDHVRYALTCRYKFNL